MEEYFWGKTYEVTEELAMIRPLLEEAVKYQRGQSGYTIPYSYWTDKKGWLYIRWYMDSDTKLKPVWRYSYDKNGRLSADELL